MPRLVRILETALYVADLMRASAFQRPRQLLASRACAGYKPGTSSKP